MATGTLTLDSFDETQWIREAVDMTTTPSHFFGGADNGVINGDIISLVVLVRAWNPGLKTGADSNNEKSLSTKHFAC